MFQARCAREPEQVLRYCFEPGAAPLWPGLARRPGPDDVPACPNCGTARRFEFQIMPQLIHFLGEDDADPLSLDWGAIAVYSCPRSCRRAGEGGSAYVEEFVWVQPTQ
jgi:pre-rRNA-processing protein TSR4